jgi:hypothetical protein
MRGPARSRPDNAYGLRGTDIIVGCILILQQILKAILETRYTFFFLFDFRLPILECMHTLGTDPPTPLLTGPLVWA